MILSLILMLLLLCSLGVAWSYERFYQRMMEVRPETARIHAVQETWRDDSKFYNYEICLIEQPDAPIASLKFGSFRSRWSLEELITVVRVIGENSFAPREDLWQIRFSAIVAIVIGIVLGCLACFNWDEMLKNLS